MQIHGKIYSTGDEMEMRKLSFHVAYTCIYFPVVIFILHYTTGVYSVGKYHFRSVLIILAVAEVIKYFVSDMHFKKRDYHLFKKRDEYSFIHYVGSSCNKSSLKEGCKNILTMCFMIIVYFIVSVLYGAEIYNKHEETVMFSSLLSVLTVLPICMHLGPASLISVLLRCKPSDKTEFLLYQSVYLTLLGAWLGAFFIPLDWDRPWQKWPIPCSYGAMLGFFLSHILMIFHIRRIPCKRKSKC